MNKQNERTEVVLITFVDASKLGGTAEGGLQI